MARKHWSTLVAVSVLASQTACFTTKIVTGREPETRAYVQSERQWFALAGLVPLSSPAGRECEHGVSWAESEQSGVDILINIGLGVAGGLLGAAACNGGDDNERASCAFSGASLLPFLLGTRTLEYACAAGPRSQPNWAPPPSPPPSSAQPEAVPPPTP